MRRKKRFVQFQRISPFTKCDGKGVLFNSKEYFLLRNATEKAFCSIMNRYIDKTVKGPVPPIRWGLVILVTCPINHFAAVQWIFLKIHLQFNLIFLLAPCKKQITEKSENSFRYLLLRQYTFIFNSFMQHLCDGHLTK